MPARESAATERALARVAAGQTGVDSRLMRLPGLGLGVAAVWAGAHGFTSTSGVART